MSEFSFNSNFATKMELEQEQILKECYIQEPYDICVGLTMFGLKTIKDAYIFQNFDAYVKAYQAKSQNSLELFQWNNLVDQFRIIVFFENYCKAQLLLHGYLVHMPESGNLRVPTKFIEFAKKFPDEILALRNLKSKTVQMSQMLGARYNEIIGLPEDIRASVERINGERNNLHFLNWLDSIHGSQIEGELRRIRDFYSNIEYLASRFNLKLEKHMINNDR
jgi:hypothetical protein